MKKIFFYLCIGILFFSCRKDSLTYKEELKNNLKELNILLSYIKKQYEAEFHKRKESNMIVFADCNSEENNYKTVICDAKDVLEKMNILDITEISFEKYFEDCNLNSGFNQVNFKLRKDATESTVFYRYEFCGTTKPYKSNTIEYIPIGSNWSVYIDSNVP